MMVYQTTTKPMGLIHDLNIYVHNIPYVTMFTILHNNVKWFGQWLQFIIIYTKVRLYMFQNNKWVIHNTSTNLIYV